MPRRPGLSLKLSLLLTLAVVGAMLTYATLSPAEGRPGVAVFLVVAIVSAIIAAAVLDWLVTRPLVLLARQVRRLDETSFEIPFEPSGMDEPRELGEALERLRCGVVDERAKLRALNDALEGLVGERTAALAEAQRDLFRAEKLASVGRLAAGVAHEVNNPAGVILARAGYLRGEDLPADVQEDLAVIERQAERIRDITGALLRLGRKEASVREPVDLAAIARCAIALVRLDARQKAIVLEDSLEVSMVVADAGAIEQVAYNLLRNAVQATPAGGRIVIRTRGGSLVVEDSGHGIAAEHLSRLFEPFFTTKSIGEGSGLGLAVAHGIAEDHGGRLIAENRMDGGARFTLSLG